MRQRRRPRRRWRSPRRSRCRWHRDPRTPRIAPSKRASDRRVHPADPGPAGRRGDPWTTIAKSSRAPGSGGIFVATVADRRGWDIHYALSQRMPWMPAPAPARAARRRPRGGVRCGPRGRGGGMARGSLARAVPVLGVPAREARAEGQKRLVAPARRRGGRRRAPRRRPKPARRSAAARRRASASRTQPAKFTPLGPAERAPRPVAVRPAVGRPRGFAGYSMDLCMFGLSQPMRCGSLLAYDSSACAIGGPGSGTPYRPSQPMARGSALPYHVPLSWDRPLSCPSLPPGTPCPWLPPNGVLQAAPEWATTQDPSHLGRYTIYHEPLPVRGPAEFRGTWLILVSNCGTVR